MNIRDENQREHKVERLQTVSIFSVCDKLLQHTFRIHGELLPSKWDKWTFSHLWQQMLSFRQLSSPPYSNRKTTSVIKAVGQELITS